MTNDNKQTAKLKKQCCGNCWWHERTNSGESMCYNDVSDFFADITDDNFCCRKWVGLAEKAVEETDDKA